MIDLANWPRVPREAERLKLRTLRNLLTGVAVRVPKMERLSTLLCSTGEDRQAVHGPGCGDFRR